MPKTDLVELLSRTGLLRSLSHESLSAIAAAGTLRAVEEDSYYFMQGDEVLAMGPKAAQFFIEKRVGCVGFSMAAFCTLLDVVKNYDLTKEEFLLELEQALRS